MGISNKLAALFIFISLVASGQLRADDRDISVTIDGRNYACAGQAGGNAGVVKYCECVNNNGPDLMQTAMNLATNQQLWRVKIGGWSNEQASWDKCYAAAQNSPSCH